MLRLCSVCAPSVLRLCSVVFAVLRCPALCMCGVRHGGARARLSNLSPVPRSQLCSVLWCVLGSGCKLCPWFRRRAKLKSYAAFSAVPDLGKKCMPNSNTYALDPKICLQKVLLHGARKKLHTIHQNLCPYILDCQKSTTPTTSKTMHHSISPFKIQRPGNTLKTSKKPRTHPKL